MATLVLGAVGSAIGGAFGGAILGFSGAAIGGFIGSTIGSVVDNWIVSSLAPAQRIEGARLDSLRITSSTEGAVIPRLYGRMRIGGNIIWATDFREETRTTSQGGGKGGGGGKVTTTEYLYFASFAVALCEGPITGIGRVWADGKAMDMTGITWRWYPGDEAQTADPFISAKMGAANTPAYRGTAYVVLEELDLTPFGNRLPQISFEVFRPLADPDTAEGLVRAVTLIPASGEFAYATVPVKKSSGSGSATVAENLNAIPETPDIVVALDRLQSMAPAVESVSLVVAWFGDDLRAGNCKVRPGVEVAAKTTTPSAWMVNGVSRANAFLVSRDAEDRPVYGGTPADFAVVQAIQEMKARGLRVTVYPFLLLDVPPGNTTPNPYSDNASEAGQPTFPWRGRIPMSDITTHLLLPYILAAQAQKHVTHNEAVRLLDAIVQLSVLDRDLTAPPASPADADRYIVASGATGLWAGWDLNVAIWVDGVWMRLVPRPGWLAWIADEATFFVWNGSAWQSVGVPQDISDAIFSLVNDADPTKRALFSLSGISTATTRTFTLPNTSSELAILAGTQTFNGNKTFSGTLTASGTVTVSSPAATISTSAATSTYGMGTGATTTGLTKTVNLGTGGASGSTTVVNIGSATAGAGGTTVINTPTVTFANAVTQVGMPQANLTAQLLGLGGATADVTNRLSVNTPNVLLNNAGASIDVTVNKNAAASDASFSFKTGFSVRALFGTLGSDDFTLKVSPNGSSFFDALVADRNTGRVKFPVGVALTGLAADPGSPADGWLWHNSTTGQLRARLNGATRILADQDVPWITPAAGDYALTTTGAGGAATGVLAGAAGRMDLFPFIPRDDITIDRLSVNVTTLIAAALGKIVLYAADATGRPATLILETGDLDFSTVGLKEATVAQTLRRGITYWIGKRHSSTAILSAWASTATPDLNGGTPVITARKVLRRTLAYATAAPGSWGYLASETNAGPGTAIWMRAA